MRRKALQAAWIYDKVAPVKDRFVAGYGEEALIGTLGLGSKCDSLSYDFGTDDNYADSILSLVDNLSRGVAFREFAGLTKQNLARFGLKLRASVYDGSSVRRGVIQKERYHKLQRQGGLSLQIRHTAILAQSPDGIR